MLLLFCAVGFARAVALPSQPGVRIADHLYTTSFATARDGWAAGAFGTIVRTRDGGISWQRQTSGTAEHLFGIDFADAQHGWAVGRSGLILHTEDGGEHWEPQQAASNRHLFGVTAVDPQHAWAIGDWGTILYTRDGGTSWEDRTLPRDVILNGQSWPDPEHGWIVGEMGTILATSDGGTSWNEQVSGVNKTLFGTHFRDAQEGWAVGIDGLVLHTTDGGQTWQVLQGDTEVGALEQVGFADALGNSSLYDVAVVGQRGYAVGDRGTVFVSQDGGKTWRREDEHPEWRLRWIRALSLVRGTHGALVGADGLTIRIAAGKIEPPEASEHVAEAPR